MKYTNGLPTGVLNIRKQQSLSKKEDKPLPPPRHLIFHTLVQMTGKDEY